MRYYWYNYIHNKHIYIYILWQMLSWKIMMISDWIWRTLFSDKATRHEALKKDTSSPSVLAKDPATGRSCNLEATHPVTSLLLVRLSALIFCLLTVLRKSETPFLSTGLMISRDVELNSGPRRPRNTRNLGKKGPQASSPCPFPSDLSSYRFFVYHQCFH